MNRIARLSIGLVVLCCFSIGKLYSQCNNPPNGVDCLCSTAQLLCTPDDLDGFTFSMSSATNFGGLPFFDLCPPSNGIGGVPNNVNWFSFIAWCTDLTLDVNITNCSEAPNGFYGVQLALFENCPTATGGNWSPLACITDSDITPVCGDSQTNYPTLETISVSNLTIGNVYYFMLDGCGGSACDVIINVPNVCGTGMIDPWTTGLTGPMETCVGNTDTYVAEDLDGAVEFYYYLDGVQIATGDELTTIDQTWTTAGTYELCVDVSNLPCIPESNDPPQNCITIQVCEEADAGIIGIDTSPACPGETINFTLSGNTIIPDHNQYILILDASGNIIQVSNSNTSTFTHHECNNFTVVSYNVKSGGPTPMIGQNFASTFVCTDACCDIEIQQFSFEDNEIPIFVDPPTDITLACADDVTPMEDLNWTDNCDGTGVVTGMEVGSFDLCSGGSLTRTWTYTDQCNNTATHVQNITIDPLELASYDSPPSNMTVACDQVPTTASDLMYTNNEIGNCLISGTVTPVIEDNSDLCGGNVTITWTEVDPCGNDLIHIQTITVDPAPSPVFIAPPADMTVTCDQIPVSAPDLMYSNSTPSCLIEDTVSPVMAGSADECGGSITFTWQDIDPCGIPIIHIQTITVDPAPIATFTSLPSDMTVDCNNLPSVTPMDLMLTNGETEDCLIDGTVSPTSSGSIDICGSSITYNWDFIDDCGRQVNHSQTITVDPITAPSFVDPPADITVTCDNIPISGVDLMYTNYETGACLEEGFISPVQDGIIDACGGSYSYIWNHIDQCGNPISHVQNITISSPPLPQFIDPPADITVDCADVPVGASDLGYTNNDACLIMGTAAPIQNGTVDACGGTIQFIWMDVDDCGNDLSHTQTITVNSAPQAIFIDPPQSMTISCDEIPISAPDLNYDNQVAGLCNISGTVSPVEAGDINECGGTLTYTWQFMDDCGRNLVHIQNITVEPAAQASFDNLPQDMNVSCAEAITPPGDLDYTNSETGICEISGSVSPTQNGSLDACGGEIAYTWSFTDRCDRTIEHTQTFTVSPAPEASFINIPPDITVDCSAVPAVPPTINYSNQQIGACLIAGSVTAIQAGNYDVCGGELIYTWTFIDECHRPITTSQTVVVNPALPPSFDAVPPDLTLDCNDNSYNPPTLLFTNGESGSCEINQNITATSTVNGNTTIYTWTAQDPCTLQEISISQNVIIPAIPDISIMPEFIVLCQDEQYDLNAIVVSDNNNTNPNITFHSGSPATTTNIITDLNFIGSIDQNIYVLATSVDGCTDEVALPVFIDIPVFAGTDGSGVSCTDNQSFNLFDYISNLSNASGTWYWEVTPDNFVAIPSFGIANSFGIGVYDFYYIVPSINSCPPDTAIASVQFYTPITINLTNSECSLDLSTYSVDVSTIASAINVNVGVVVDLGSGNFEINDIPIASQLVITASEDNSPCIAELIVNPPDCNCPVVDAPLSNGDIVLCADDLPGILEVTVGNNETANWYNDPQGNNLLLAGNTSFTSPENSAGIYTYYVQTESLEFPDCLSTTLTPVVLTIVDLPIAMDFSFSSCDDDQDGLLEFDLDALSDNLGQGPIFQIDFYANIADAQAEINPIASPYTNTSPFQTSLVAVIKNASECSDTSMLDLQVLALPDFTLDIQNEICKDDALGQVSISNSIGVDSISLDGIEFFTDLSIDSLPADNYTLYAKSDETCISTQDFTIAMGQELMVLDFAAVCNDNTTESDPADDFYTIDFRIVDNMSNVGSFELLQSGQSLGIFDYDIDYQIDVLADGMSYTLVIIDTVTGCQLSQDIGPLNSCSTNCNISFDQLDYVCDDAGTPSDPSDDFYMVTIRASAVNGGSNNTYNVLINGTVSYSYGYGVTEQFTLPADGTSPNISIVDNQDLQCGNAQSIGPLISCSDLCTITYSISDLLCDNNGTENDENDDTYTFTLIVEGQNISSTWSSMDGSLNGAYGMALSVGPLLISDGAFVLDISDNMDASCIVTLDVNPPASCSSPCEIALQNINITDCFDNNTGNTEFDDTFELSFELVSVLGMSNQYIATIGTANYGPYDYDITQTITSLSADGSTFNVMIEDISFGQCILDTMLMAPPPCSSCDETVEAGVDVSLDCNQTSADLTAMAMGASSFQWTGPNFSQIAQSVNVSIPGTYVVEAIFDNGCNALDSLTVEVSDDVPVANAGPDMELTCDIDEVTIAAIISNTNNILITWTNAQGDTIGTSPSFVTDVTGNFFLSLRDTITNCSSSLDQVNVSFNTNEPSAVIYADPSNTLDCFIESVVLTNDEEENVVYSWAFDGKPISIDPIVVTTQGEVTLIAIDTINGCQSQDTLQVSDLQQFPFVNIDEPDILSCDNEEVDLMATSASSGINIVYQWLDINENVINPNGSETVTITEGGTYYLQLTDTLLGCTSIDTVIVSSIVELPDISLDDNIQLDCGETSTTVQVEINNDLGPLQIEWTTTDGNIVSDPSMATLDIEGTGSYTVNVTVIATGCNIEETVQLTVFEEVPEIGLLSVEDESCFEISDGQILIDEVIGGLEPYMFSLDGGPFQTENIFDNLVPDMYLLEIIDANGCETDTTISIAAAEVLTIEDLPTVSLQQGASQTIEVITNILAENVASITWLPSNGLSCDDCLNPTISGQISQVYTLTIQDINGCSVSASLVLEVDVPNIKVYVPNVFSPNDDNVNEGFTLFADENVELIEELLIYDRWGELVFINSNFLPNDPSLGWDGIFKGEPAMEGVYAYIFSVRYVDGEQEYIAGDVTMIR